MKKEYLIYKLSEDLKEATRIENELFKKFDVKRGLRNEDGTGVLVGLTKIGNVVGYERIPGGGLKPIPGKLFYRGYDLEDLAHAILKEKRFGFEEVAYLLLSGRLPDREELASFRELINDNMPLEQKTKMNIIELEGNNIMNILARSVLEMYRFDPNADDTSRDNLMRQSIDLISKFPTIIAYAFNMLRHATHGRSLHIRHPQENLSLAENFLYMLKKDYTELDARTLDLLLVLQAEHGGGNNSIKENFRQLGEYDNEDICHLHYQKAKAKTKEEKRYYIRGLRRLLDWISGYGTKPCRTFLTIILLILIFGTAYYVIPCLQYQGVSGWLECIYASAITFFAVGYGDLFPATLATKMVSLIEAFSGVTMTSYFLVILSRKVIR